MKVLQINAVNGIGSTGRTSTEIADFLNSNGHEGYIAYSHGIPYPSGYKIGDRIDHKIHGLLSRISGKQAYFSRKETIKLLSYIGELNPDVVHLRNIHGNYIHLNLMLDFLAENDVPTVITLHDCWFYTGKCTHYTLDNCFRWQDECGRCPRLKKDNPSWFFDRTSEMLKDKRERFSKIPRLAVVGVSDWITNEAKLSFLSSAKILRRIYNWIDMDIFKPVENEGLMEKLGLEKKYIILGVASSWSDSKGLNRFIELAGVIPKNMQILLVGKMSNDKNLPTNIIHIPETKDASQLAQYYSLADVYLHLSEEETFGKTIAEAMSCGTPAVVLNSTACPEVVGDGGIIIDFYSPEAVLNAIEILKLETKTFHRRKTIERVRNNFRKEDLIAEHILLYKEISERNVG